MADIYNFADTWNAGGTTFYGIKLNVTDTASASASMLQALQVGGVTKFGVTKDGGLYSSRTNAGVSLELRNSDAANLGVAIQTYHDSPSPAVSDYVAYWNIRGKDSGGNDTLYGYFQCLILDPTDGAEKGLVLVGAGGGSQLHIGQGIYTVGTSAPGDTNVIAARQLKTQARTVAQLPAAGTVGDGTRGFVSDSTVAYAAAALGTAVAGGGANPCPVIVIAGAWVIGG